MVRKNRVIVLTSVIQNLQLLLITPPNFLNSFTLTLRSKFVKSGQRILTTGRIAGGLSLGKFNATLDCVCGRPVGTLVDIIEGNLDIIAHQKCPFPWGCDAVRSSSVQLCQQLLATNSIKRLQTEKSCCKVGLLG